MKKILILFSFLLLSIGTFGQKFFAPIPKDYFATGGEKALKGSHDWIIRPQLGVVGVIWYWNKDLDGFESQPFDWIGLGAGYEYYRPTSESDPTPYSLVGVNALVIFGPQITGAITIKALGILNAGVSYNFAMAKFGLLTGLQFRF